MLSKLKTLTVTTAIGVALMATGASAASLTINSVTGVWSNLSPAAGISGGGTNIISWGTGVGGGPQSGYTFNGAAPPPFVANEGVDFTLGTFIHRNNPITGTSLSSADLTVSVNVAGYGVINSVFSFAHNETPNGANPCANGQANGSGVNVNGCADQVTATLNVGASDTFTLGGIEYVFDISGFEVGGTTFNDFWTVEQQNNAARLVGSFVTKSSVIPLPAAGWMLIAGLGGLAAMRRRKKAA